MYQNRKIFRILEKKKQKEEKFICFLKNGGLLVEELIVSLGGRYKLPIPNFSAEEIINATKDFSEPLHHICDNGYMFKGTLKERAVLVRIFRGEGSLFSVSNRKKEVVDEMIRDTAITSQMSHLRNVLKLIGCCLEFRYPAMVYEYAGTKLLSSVLNYPSYSKLLSWKSRLKIANDIANVIVHLHTDFPTPIVYRDLSPSKVAIDHQGLSKLFDFTCSISLPPGELKVKDDFIKGTLGYLDPEYTVSGYFTMKTDVYSFGVLMLMLFMGNTSILWYPGGEREGMHIINYVNDYFQKDQLIQIMDPKLEENIVNEERQQMIAFVDLALRCTHFEGKDRPDMIDVARELRRIEKEFCPC